MLAPLIDSFGRRLDYLRISVTDRCNFRCVYCMPAEGLPTLPSRELLSFDEIERIARIFVALGGRKLRITGGEPLLRPGVTELIARLAQLSPRPTIALTTNGFYLASLAQQLRDAGLDQINISLDSLDAQRFSQITLSNSFERVWRGIQAALDAGLQAKINVVAMRGLQSEEILRFTQLAHDHPVDVRFIEFMPLCGTGWHPEWMIPISEIRDAIRTRFTLAGKTRGSDVAESFDLVGGRGSVGFIASMTESFCSQCSRLRLTADGKLRLCLFSHAEIDLKLWLRTGGSDDDFIAAFRHGTALKPAGGAERALQQPLHMPYIRAVGG